MISIYKLKPKFQKLLTPMLNMLHHFNITANQITIASILLSLFIGFSFWMATNNRLLFLILPIGLFLRMALNALDGMMARTFNQQTKLGEALNEIGDIISDLVIFLPLITYEYKSIYLVVLFITFSIINEFAGLLGKVISNERRYDGPMGKSDRALFIGVYGILSYLSIDFHTYFQWVLCSAIILLTLSTFTRLKKALN